MISMEFVRAGRAVFTVSNNSGKHMTFKVIKFVNQGNGLDSFYVMRKEGSRFQYMGFLNGRDEVQLTFKSRNVYGLSNTSDCVLVFNWAMKVIKGISKLPYGYDIKHEGKCGRCGRNLTHPQSIETGFGPECVKHYTLKAA